MKNRFISMLLCMMMILTACGYRPHLAEAYYIECNQEHYTYRDMAILKAKISEQEARMEAAHAMAEAGRALGYAETHIVITTAKNEYQEADKIRAQYQTIYDNLESHWQMKEKEYPEASYVWKTLMDEGYNDEVIAGILGNMMAECGGHTLALQPTVSTPSYYGICQWSHGYPDVWGASLEEQVQFLLSTIEYELNEFGYLYKKGANYESFLLLTDIQQVALMFAKSYERCGASTHKLRQRLAVEAYNYFVS